MGVRCAATGWKRRRDVPSAGIRLCGHRSGALDDHGSDVAGVVQRNHFEQAVGQLLARGRHALVERTCGRLGVGQVVSLHALAKQLAVGHDAAHRDAAKVHAVVALFAADQARLGALALGAPVGAGHLQRRVGRLGARAGEEHIVQPCGRQFLHAVGQLERQRVAKLEGGGVIELHRLLADGLGDLAAAMAQARAPQARETVENFAAFGVGVVGTAALHDHARVGLELAVGGVGHPVRVQPLGVHAGCSASGGGVDGGKAHGVSPMQMGPQPGH